MNTLAQIAVLLAAATLTSTSVVMPPAKGAFELLILHNNDMHARFEQTNQMSGVCEQADSDNGKCYGGFPRVAHVVKQAREAEASGEGPPVLYLNAGDTYTGTAWFTIYKWKIAAEFVNALRPDAVSLGNHEFDNGVAGMIPFVRDLSTPVLAANLKLDKVPELEKEANLRKSVILTKNGVKIGVIGYLTSDTKFLAPANDVEYEEEVDAITREVRKLKTQEVHILIALGHSGYLKDRDIAEKVEDIDLVIGGHSNTFLWNSNTTDEKPEYPQGMYPEIVTQSSGRKVLVVQAYAYTKYMGSLHLVFNSDGEIVKYDGTPILLSQNITRDEEVLKIVEKYQQDKTINEVVGTSMVSLDGDTCRLRECNAGNIITDAMLYYAKTHKNLDVNIAAIQGGRIRSSINHLPIPFNTTRKDWTTVLPFSDNLTMITLHGKVLLEALEHSVDTWRPVDTPGQFLQLSGIKVIYDIAKPAGSRVTDAKAVCSNCDASGLTDIVENFEYKIIMPRFLVNGGDGYNMFKDVVRETLQFNELTAVLEYLKVHNPINPKAEGRITIKNEEAAKDYVYTLRQDRELPSGSSSEKLSTCFKQICILISFRYLLL